MDAPRSQNEAMPTCRKYLLDSRGAAAVEFAITASALTLTIVFIMFVALIIYLNEALDYATSKAARQVMTGNVQKNSMSQASFQAAVCSYLPASMSCNNVIVNLYAVTEGSNPSVYYSFINSTSTGLLMPTLSNTGASYQLGNQATYQYLLVIYPITFIPSAFAKMLGSTTYNGSPAYLAVSTAAFRNEQY